MFFALPSALCSSSFFAEIKALAMFNVGLAVAVNNRRFVPPPPMAPGGPKEEPRPPGEGGGEEGEMGLGADLKKAIEAMAETAGEKLKSPAPDRKSTRLNSSH